MSPIDRTVRTLYVHVFFRSLHFFSATLVPFFTVRSGLTLTEVQTLQSWCLLMFFAFQIPTGGFADRFGRKNTIALGAVGMVVSLLGYGLSGTFLAFLFWETTFGIAFALISGADDAFLYDTLLEAGREAEAKHLIGRMRSVAAFGRLVSAPIGGLMAASWGLAAPLLWTAIPACIAGIMAFTLREPRVHAERTRPHILAILRSGSTYLLTHPRLRILALDGAGIAAAGYFVIWLYQPVLQELAIPIAFFGLIHCLLNGSQMLVGWNIQRFEKWFGTHGFLHLCTLTTAGSFLLVAVAPSLWTVSLLLVFGGGFGLIRFEYLLAHMQDDIPSAERATILSTIQMVRSIALVILNPVVGFVAERSLPMALTFVGAIALSVFVFSPIRKLQLH